MSIFFCIVLVVFCLLFVYIGSVMGKVTHTIDPRIFNILENREDARKLRNAVWSRDNKPKTLVTSDGKVYKIIRAKPKHD